MNELNFDKIVEKLNRDRNFLYDFTNGDQLYIGFCTIGRVNSGETEDSIEIALGAAESDNIRYAAMHEYYDASEIKEAVARFIERIQMNL